MKIRIKTERPQEIRGDEMVVVGDRFYVKSSDSNQSVTYLGVIGKTRLGARAFMATETAVHRVMNENVRMVNCIQPQWLDFFESAFLTATRKSYSDQCATHARLCVDLARENFDNVYGEVLTLVAQNG